jgi:hypothetical protein
VFRQSTAQQHLSLALEQSKVRDTVKAFAILACFLLTPYVAIAADRAPRGSNYKAHSRVRTASNGVVEAIAEINSKTCTARIKLNLATDNVLVGPTGCAELRLYDAKGRVIHRLSTDVVKIGGKPPGKALRKTFTYDLQIPAAILAKTKRVEVGAAFKGDCAELWSVDFEHVRKILEALLRGRPKPNE